MSDTSNTTRQQAHLNWDAQGQPLCARFDDLYFSNEDGLAETRYVFLANNQLPERFAALAAGEDPKVVWLALCEANHVPRERWAGKPQAKKSTSS